GASILPPPLLRAVSPTARFLFHTAETVRENSSDGVAQLRLRADQPRYRRRDRRTGKAGLLPAAADRRRAGQPGAGEGSASGDDGAVAGGLRAGRGPRRGGCAEHGTGRTHHPTLASWIHHADLQPGREELRNLVGRAR